MTFNSIAASFFSSTVNSFKGLFSPMARVSDIRLQSRSRSFVSQITLNLKSGHCTDVASFRFHDKDKYQGTKCSFSCNCDTEQQNEQTWDAQYDQRDIGMNNRNPKKLITSTVKFEYFADIYSQHFSSK